MAAPAADASLAEVPEQGFFPFASFTEGSDEVNHLTVSIQPGQTLRFDDSVSPITAGANCQEVPLSAFQVDCQLRNRPKFYLTLFVSTGGQDDELTSLIEEDAGGTGTFPFLFFKTGEGVDMIHAGPADENVIPGPGNDLVYGQRGYDYFTSGRNPDGADLFHGGGRGALVDYHARDARTFVDFDGVADDGEKGENDQLIRIDGAVGGHAVDRFTGNQLPNLFYTARGPDRLDARAGGDFLIGGKGGDIIDAGAGDDIVFDAQWKGTDLVDCGPGEDVLFGDDHDLVSNCEKLRDNSPFSKVASKRSVRADFGPQLRAFRAAKHAPR